MIIFSSIIPPIDYIRDSNEDKNLYIYELSNNINYGFNKLTELVSFDYNPNLDNPIEELHCDINYHSKLINDKITFYNLFTRVIEPHNRNDIVYLLFDYNDFDIIESLIKFINIRYGTKCFISNTFSDVYDILKNDSYIENLDNYDFDLNRVSQLISESKLIQVDLFNGA